MGSSTSFVRHSLDVRSLICSTLLPFLSFYFSLNSPRPSSPASFPAEALPSSCDGHKLYSYFGPRGFSPAISSLVVPMPLFRSTIRDFSNLIRRFFGDCGRFLAIEAAEECRQNTSRWNINFLYSPTTDQITSIGQSFLSKLERDSDWGFIPCRFYLARTVTIFGSRKRSTLKAAPNSSIGPNPSD